MIEKQPHQHKRTAADAHAEDMADMAAQAGGWERFAQDPSAHNQQETAPVGEPIKMNAVARRIEVAKGLKALSRYLEDK